MNIGGFEIFGYFIQFSIKWMQLMTHFSLISNDPPAGNCKEHEKEQRTVI